MRPFLLAGSVAAWLCGPATAGETPVPGAAPLTAPLPTRPIILDAGHGGMDYGAMRRGHVEKELALVLARKVAERLRREGVPTRLTRDADEFVPLDKRIRQSVAWDGAAFVSLHLNQDRNRSAEGIEVYAFGNDRRIRRSGWRIRRRKGLPNIPPPPKAARAASADLASSLVRSLRTRGLKVFKSEKAAFYVLKNPAIPSVLVELGYLSNPREAARLADPAYQDLLADAVAGSLRDYLATLDPPPAALAVK
ncbi:MAG: N-acetylmuramoyl-L-alanine amidase [Elusimicrobia bacterium]|nr:N-acetylmuramoyl-L-alanine amidase [Elusimicrobiota bacterium]